MVSRAAMHCVGIDLGTTNTVAAVHAAVLPLRNVGATSPILPSVVAFPPDGQPLVGAAARARRAIDVKNTIFSAKRVIGEKWHSYRAAEFRRNYPFDFVEGADGGVEFLTRAGSFSPTAIGRQVIAALCSETELDPADATAVVTVPASFEPAQREATRKAVLDAGFAAAHTIAEPVATALAYLDRNSVHYGAVFDLGGGTFDLAIIDCWSQPMTVVAHGGELYLGGDDIDRALAASIAGHVLETRRWDLRASPEIFDRLVLAAEEIKIELSSKEQSTLDIGAVDAAAPPMPPVLIDRAHVWRLASKLVGRAFRICDEVLGDAGLRAQDLEAVFMAGGATLMPGVRAAVSEYFGHRVRSELDPMHVVSLGASLAATRPALSGLLHGPG